MGKDPSRRSRDLTPRERREELQRFSPADAAFVAHLTGCGRCREQAARLLTGAETTPGGGLAMLSSLERGILHQVARGGDPPARADDVPRADLPLGELQSFVSALPPEQAAFIGHLLGCERCLREVARLLKPRTPPRRSGAARHARGSVRSR